MLYPPIIDKTLPAQTKQHFQIPFRYSAGVSATDITGIKIYIKSIKTNETITVMKAMGYANNIAYVTHNSWAKDLNINNLTPLNAFDILIQLKNYLKKD